MPEWMFEAQWYCRPIDGRCGEMVPGVWLLGLMGFGIGAATLYIWCHIRRWWFRNV